MEKYRGSLGVAITGGLTEEVTIYDRRDRQGVVVEGEAEKVALVVSTPISRPRGHIQSSPSRKRGDH